MKDYRCSRCGKVMTVVEYMLSNVCGECVDKEVEKIRRW